jgi:malonyl CoA-acyl carrier protein transacylase/thioesterase domain-containing protein/aryl carrier-like protein
VPARDVDYLEAHGTGTILGDPIELQAALAVYSEERDSNRPLIVGSVKTNIGHLEAAAGLAGFAKAVLALQHREIPASLNFKRLNPVLSPLSTRIEVPTQSREWLQPANGRRLAAVTSMGISGTNSHVVLEEAPEPRPAPDSPDVPGLLTLSARTAAALDQQLARYAHHLAAHPEIGLRELCATAALGRTHFDERIAVAATSRDELRAALTALARGDVPAGCARGSAVTQEPPRLVFLFPGQGAQYSGMGRTLYEREPVFRAALDRCAAAMEALLDRPLLAVLFSDEATTILDETAYAQPALFALAVSLAELWRSWGIVPEAVVGQSQGEIAAACVAGALSLEDAARVVCHRSRLLRPLRGRGAMAVVGLSEAQTFEHLAGRTHQISIAVTNGSASTVVSGDIDAVQALVGELESQGVFCRRLKVDYSSHSHHVDEIRGELSAALADIHPREGSVPLYSTVTCERLSGRELDAEYWVRNLRQPVRFASLMARMVGEGFGRFVEVSPHPSMGMAMAEWIGSIAGGGWVPSLRREGDDCASMLAGLAELYVRGVEVDWNRLYPDARRQRAELPTYAFQRRRYWRMALGSVPVELTTGSDTDLVETLPAKQAFRERLAAAPPEERSELLIAQLRTLLSGLLGDGAASIPIESNLLSRGMNSLRIMSFLASVQRAVDCICLPVDFIREPTLRGFAAYLEERLAPAPPAVELASVPATAAPPELIVLRAEGSEPPVFCSHPAGGQVTAYLRLRALLGEERPLYGIQSRACQDPDREHESLAAMASEYANIIQATRPEPYVLLGWSMGAVLSHAIAVELEQRGQHVRLVAMIDPPRAGRLEIDDIAEAVRATVLEVRPEHAVTEALLQRFRGLASLPGGNTADLFKLCEEHRLLEKGSVSAETFDAMVRLRLRHFQIVRAHRPGVIRADTAIWWASEPHTTGQWSSHTRGHLTERFLGGFHYTIMLSPRIDVIANDLRAAILSGVESLAAVPSAPSQSSAGLEA